MSEPAVLNRTIEHVRAAIDTAAESRDPFEHIQLAGIFPADIYAEMLEGMPSDEDYRPMSGRARRERVRTKIDLLPEWTRTLPPAKRGVWEVVGETLRSIQVRDAFVRKLATQLERRFGAGYATVGVYPIPILTRDVPGYRIGIHADTPRKGITIQLYLPRDRSIEHVGTIFHRRASGNGAFEVALRMPFAPNTGYAFVVAKDTHHSVDTVGPEVRTRDSILLTYFVDQTLLERVHNRGKRFGNLLRATARRFT